MVSDYNQFYDAKDIVGKTIKRVFTSDSHVTIFVENDNFIRFVLKHDIDSPYLEVTQDFPELSEQREFGMITEEKYRQIVEHNNKNLENYKLRKEYEQYKVMKQFFEEGKGKEFIEKLYKEMATELGDM